MIFLCSSLIYACVGSWKQTKQLKKKKKKTFVTNVNIQNMNI